MRARSLSIANCSHFGSNLSVLTSAQHQQACYSCNINMSSTLRIKDFSLVMPKADTALETVADICGPLINDWIGKFQAGLVVDGVEAFQSHLIDEIAKVRLGENQWHHVSRVIAHPDNREGSLLVPVDVHDLLKHLVHNGWNFKRVDACAAELPDGEEGKRWLQKIEKVVKQADGLLPRPQALDRVAIATVRGSHTTSVVQLLDTAPLCKGIHPECCGIDGKISKTKILEKQPSLQEPLDKGIEYFVVSKKLVAKCPKLMSILARTGNVVHGTYRHATALQSCMRIHEVLVQNPKKTDAEIIREAGVGLGVEFTDEAETLLPFVRMLSGGTQGYVLKSLEEYERQLSVKRKIHPADFKQKANIDPLSLERFLCAMVKAELNAPSNYVDTLGYSTMFPSTGSDCGGLARGATVRQHAQVANQWMVHGSNFLGAYAREMPETIKSKLLSQFEVNLVMHVMNKKLSATRKSFLSLDAIAQEFYRDAVKAVPNLPKWNRLAGMPEIQNEQEEASGVGLVELHASGQIDASELERHNSKQM